MVTVHLIENSVDTEFPLSLRDSNQCVCAACVNAFVCVCEYKKLSAAHAVYFSLYRQLWPFQSHVTLRLAYRCHYCKYIGITRILIYMLRHE